MVMLLIVTPLVASVPDTVRLNVMVMLSPLSTETGLSVVGSVIVNEVVPAPPVISKLLFVSQSELLSLSYAKQFQV